MLIGVNRWVLQSDAIPVIVWNRGRAARNPPKVRSFVFQSIFALRAHLRAGRPRSQTIP